MDILEYLTFYQHNPIADEKPVLVDTHLALLHRCIRIVLTKEHPEIITTTYEAIYNACRSIVVVSDKGEGLYDTLKLELERCTVRLCKVLGQLDIKGMEWITYFVKVCEWFNTQTVSITSRGSHILAEPECDVIRTCSSPSSLI